LDTKKLIGTIIGVTMFAVLIAGATFAWLTFGTTLGDNVYNGTTMNFVVDYTKGTAVQYLPILDSKTAKPGVNPSNTVGISATELEANEASGLVVVMKKHNNSVDGHAIVSLTTTSTTSLTTDGVVRWAICRDADVEAGTQIDDTCGGGTDFTNALNTGKITSAGTIVLLNDARLADGASCAASTIAANTKSGTFTATNDTCPGLTTGSGTFVNQTQITNNTDYLIEEDGVSYFVYFWLDGLTINNDHLDDQYGSDGSTIENNLYEGFIHAAANQMQN